MVDFLNDLNAAQREAVVNTEGPSLVIAGAGAGKTRALTYRVAYLLSRGVKPGNILALTFTNKAANEMKERIGKLVGEDLARYLWMGTFHSIFARILRIEGDALGYTSNYTIYDTADSKSLIKTILKDLKLSDQQYKPGDVYSRISSSKNNLITAQAYYNNDKIREKDTFLKRPQMADIYRLYAARCKKSNAMDFDDLLLNTNILFRDFKEKLQIYQQRFNYILVDEYQDTNHAQYLIVNKLSQMHKNICVVGDDAQSIYSFRGAKIENILNFRNDYPDYALYKLEQNYRSTKSIVNAANSIIHKNKDQIHKKVFSKNEIGERVKVIKTLTDNEEGFAVSNSIRDTILTEKQQYKDFAILYRTNAQSRIFEEALRKSNIPYKVYGGLSFYQRKEIKDMLAYLRLIVNPNDDEALKRIINYPAKGIGNVTVQKMEEYANTNELSIWNVVMQLEKISINLNQGAISRVVKFRSTILDFKNKKSEIDAYDLAQYVASQTGILKELYNGKSVEERSRYENLEELLNGIRDFVGNQEDEKNKQTIEDYLENVSLLTDLDTDKQEDNNKVKIMTIHSAKGLEFNNVYIAGAEEDLLPSKMSLDTPKGLEEERRLFYVALTRAKRKAIISYASSRYRWGKPTDCRVSRFVKEIDRQYLDWNHADDDIDLNKFLNIQTRNETEDINYQESRSSSTFQYVRASNLSKPRPFHLRTKTDENFKPDDPQKIRAGMKIEHQRFGLGKIVHIEGEFPNRKATVFFQELGQEKQLLLKFAKLRIVG